MDKCVKRNNIIEKDEINASYELCQQIGEDINNAFGYDLEIRKDTKIVYMDRDDHDRKLMNIALFDSTSNSYYYFAFVNHADLSYKKNIFSIEISGPFNCQEEICILKINNKWNISFDR